MFDAMLGSGAFQEAKGEVDLSEAPGGDIGIQGVLFYMYHGKLPPFDHPFDALNCFFALKYVDVETCFTPEGLLTRGSPLDAKQVHWTNTQLAQLMKSPSALLTPSFVTTIINTCA